MDGFYTKKEAASVLGVSTRQVNNYMTEGHLARVYSGKRAWIPKADVQKLYDRISHGKSAGPEDTADMKERLTKLEHEVEVLKLGLGFGAPRKVRTEVDLLLLRQKFIDLLARKEWSKKQISGIADDLISIQESELLIVLDRHGVSGWLPLHQICDKMLVYLENHPEFPGNGFNILQTRLLRAREKFLGLVFVTSKVPSKNMARATYLHSSLTAPGEIDRRVLDYISTLN